MAGQGCEGRVKRAGAVSGSACGSGVVVGLLALVTMESARAQSLGTAPAAWVSADDGPRLEWLAPLDCPTRGEVVSHVGLLASNDDVSWSRFEVIRGEVSPDGDGWALALEFVGQGGVRKRRMRSGRCADLAEAAAVAIVLAHRSAEGLSAEGLSAEEEGALGVLEERSVAQPSDVADDGKAMRSADEVASVVSLAVQAEGVVDPTTLGSAAFGGAVGVDLRVAAFSVGVYGAGLPSVTTPLGNGQAIALELWTGGLRGCARFGRGLDTCALMELGRVGAEGVGLAQSREGRDLWAAPGFSVGFVSTPFDGFGITTRVSIFHPLVRGRFRVNDSELVHQIPVLGIRAAVGIDVPVL